MREEIFKIQNHRKDLIGIINRNLKDKLSRYQRALEISEQTLKVFNENPQGNSVDKSLMLLREVMPRDSLSTLELIKGVLFQSQIMKSTGVPRALIKTNTNEEDEEDQYQEENHQVPKKKVHLEEKLEQPKQRLDNLFSCEKTDIQTENPKLIEKDNEATVGIPQPQQPIKTEEKQNYPEQTQTTKLNQQTQMIIEPIQDPKVENNEEEDDLLFQKYIERINRFEENNFMKLPEKFKQKGLFVLRTQNPNLTTMRLLDESDKKIIFTLAKIFKTTDEVANLLQLPLGLIKKIVFFPQTSNN